MYSQLSHIDQSKNWTMSELSMVKAGTLIVSIVYLCILMVVGIIGNTLVIVIFYTRFSPTTYRCFILTLAFYDMFACVVGAPFTIAESFLAFTYYDEVSCKILRFVLYYTCIASSFTLVLIAIERSRKICTPLKSQFTLSLAKKSLFVVSCGLAALASSPAFVLYGNSSVDTGYRNVTGTKCFIKDHFNLTYWPVIFNVFLLFLGFLCTTIMCVCYVRIARTVSKMGTANIAKRMTKADDKLERSDKSETSSVMGDESEAELPSLLETEVDHRTSRCSDTSTGTGSSLKPFERNKSNRVKLRNKSSRWANQMLRRLASASGKKTMRVTKMLTFVTVAFIISYLPHLTLMIWSLMDSDEGSLPTDNVYAFMFYSFLVNNIINPFIYAAMDVKFRTELKKYFHCVFRKFEKR